MSGAVADLLVVVPARDEEARLPGCLAALDLAAAAVADRARVLVVVVLDRCRDRSAEVVARWPRVLAVPSPAGSAGGARAIGVTAGLAALARPGEPADGSGRPAGAGVWIASTDADSLVPPHWLQHQLDVAAAGADLVLGTVRPRADELPPGLITAWEAGYEPAEGHPHVHAANLGVRADVYLAVGGFAAVPTHEDVLLADAVRAAGGRVLSTAAAPVLTSGRLVGRAPAGFADHLALLRGGVAVPVQVPRGPRVAPSAPVDAVER